MSNKNRWIIEVIFLTIATVFAFAYNGISQTWHMLLGFYLILIGYEVILYFKRIKK